MYYINVIKSSKKMQFMSVDLLITGKGYFLKKMLKLINARNRYFKESLFTDLKY